MRYSIGAKQRERILSSIKPGGSILQWGMGESTVWFSENMSSDSRLNCVEHDYSVYAKTGIKLFNRKNTRLILREPTDPADSDLDSCEENPSIFYNYIHAVDGEQFDVIIVNGAVRNACMSHAKNLLTKNGIIFLYNAERELYDIGKIHYIDYGHIGSCPESSTAHLWWGGNSTIKNICGDDGAFPLIVSAYTTGTDYENEAQNLIASCERLGLKYKIEGYEPLGSWALNCSYKSRYLLKVWEQYKQPILWVDCDAVIKELPYLLKSSDADFAIHKIDRWEFASGTVYFNYSEFAGILLNSWAEKCANNPFVLDQINLDLAWEEAILHYPLETMWLPQIYTKIFDRASDDWTSQPVIEHYQASRRFKKKMGDQKLENSYTSPEIAEARKASRPRACFIPIKELAIINNKCDEKEVLICEAKLLMKNGQYVDALNAVNKIRAIDPSDEFILKAKPLLDQITTLNHHSELVCNESITDHHRWTQNAKQTPTWDKRVELIASLILPGASVLDVGAGAMTLKRYLAPGTLYTPLDAVPSSDETIIVDFNAHTIPHLNTKYDVAVCSGVMEYILPIDVFLDTISKWAHSIILTYAVTDLNCDMDRRKRCGWLNHLSSDDLHNLFDRHGLKIKSHILWEKQWIYIIDCSSSNHSIYYTSDMSTSDQLHSEILSIFRFDSTNAGDYFCPPFRYFNFGSYRCKDIIDVKDPSELPQKLIIGGGGLLGSSSFNPYFETLFSRNYEAVVGWGLGENSRIDCTAGYVERDKLVYPSYTDKFDLLGVRDYGTEYDWVPCASCMHPFFKEKWQITNEIVVFEHKRVPIEIDYFPKMNNDTIELETIIRFLGTARVVITNSYHAAYWSQLMGKAVVVFPFSTKFYYFKHKAAIGKPTEWKKLLNMVEEQVPALNECINANIEFNSRVRGCLGMRTKI